LVSYGCLRRLPPYRFIEKVEHFRMRVLWQRFEKLLALQNFQQLRRRCAGGEQPLQLPLDIGVSEAAGLKCA